MTSKIKEVSTDGIVISAIVEYFDSDILIYRGTTIVDPDGSVENVKAAIDVDIANTISRLDNEKAKAEQCSWLVNELKTLLGA